ncbi:glutathione S-transferase T3-like [Raphanus sativus]|uniref:Glutathione S-transferase T3-like n=1 Tax=Raphanus sativus TaxID=3726 RepID=A0A6J0M3Y0_RAPSA|nr:glutathione S-transferase T3-like [Raphanus sativus]
MANIGGYVNLLKSQTSVDLESPEQLWFGAEGPDEPCEPSEPSVKERRKWSPKEDKILIGAWLNTSKDPIISNEQKAGAFWKRIVEYYNASPLLVGSTPRELGQCKQRWSRINGDVCKFVGCFETALRQQRSGQNDDDVMKAAHDIFFNDQGTKFILDHCWRELRYDQKWCTNFVPKDGVKAKRKQVAEGVPGEEEVREPEARPMGVKAAKAAKAAGKRKMSAREEELAKLQGVEVTDGQVTGYQVTGYQVTGYHQVTGVGSVVA